MYGSGALYVDWEPEIMNDKKLFINYSIYSTYTGKWVSVIPVTFLLSYSIYLILPRTYTAYLGPIRFTLDNMDYTLNQCRNPCS